MKSVIPQRGKAYRYTGVKEKALSGEVVCTLSKKVNDGTREFIFKWCPSFMDIPSERLYFHMRQDGKIFYVPSGDSAGKDAFGVQQVTFIAL